VLSQVHSDTSITPRSIDIICDFAFDILLQVCLEAENLCRFNNRNTITSREIQTAVRLTLQGELAKQSVSEGTKALTKYNSRIDEGEITVGIATVAGLVFPFGKIDKIIKDHWLGGVGSGASVYLAGVIEYLCAEILELSGNAAGTDTGSNNTIYPRHIMLAIRNDEELDRLCRWTIIPDSGGLPNIMSCLLPPGRPDSGDEGNIKETEPTGFQSTLLF